MEATATWPTVYWHNPMGAILALWLDLRTFSCGLTSSACNFCFWRDKKQDAWKTPIIGNLGVLATFNLLSISYRHQLSFRGTHVWRIPKIRSAPVPLKVRGSSVLIVKYLWLGSGKEFSEIACRSNVGRFLGKFGCYFLGFTSLQKSVLSLAKSYQIWLVLPRM